MSQGFIGSERLRVKVLLVNRLSHESNKKGDPGYLDSVRSEETSVRNEQGVDCMCLLFLEHLLSFCCHSACCFSSHLENEELLIVGGAVQHSSWDSISQFRKSSDERTDVWNELIQKAYNIGE